MGWLFVRRVFLRKVILGLIIVFTMFLGQHWNLFTHNLRALQVMRGAIVVLDKADYACCDTDCQIYLEGWHPHGVIGAYWKAWDLFVAGKKMQAFQVWREAGVSEYFITAGEARFNRGNINGAIKCLELATQIDPQRADTWYVLSVVLQSSGKHTAQTSVEALDRALELGIATINRTRYLQYYLQASNVYEMHGEWSKAIKLAERATYLSPKWSTPLVKLALYYDRLGDMTTSQQYLAEAKRIDPYDFWPWLLEGDIQRRHGQLDAAHDSYLWAQALAPTASEPIVRLVDLSVHSGQLDQALNDLHTIIAKQPTCHLAYYYLGWIYYLQGHYAEAIKQYRIAIGLQPQSAQYLIDMGDAYVGLGDRENAIATYCRAIEVNHNYAQIVEMRLKQIEALTCP
jgi:tetratricopeptide (TPR) repeat protein